MTDRRYNTGRHISLDKAHRTGSGYAADVYLIEEDNVVKVLKNGTFADAEREMKLAKWAFSRGIPTAISYDIVDADGNPGLVYESLGHESLKTEFRDHPEHFDETLSRYISLLRYINGIVCDDGSLPRIYDKFARELDIAAGLIGTEEYMKMSALLKTVPDAQTVVHADCQIKNVRLRAGELLLIDFDSLSRGDPIFELVGLCCAYQCYSELTDSDFEPFYELPKSLLKKILDGVFDLYAGAITDEEKFFNRRKVEVLSYMHMLACVVTDMDGDENAARIMLRRFREVLAPVDDLRLVIR